MHTTEFFYSIHGKVTLTNPSQKIIALFDLINNPPENLRDSIIAPGLTQEELSQSYKADSRGKEINITALGVAAGNLSVKAIEVLLEQNVSPDILIQGYRQQSSALYNAIWDFNDKKQVEKNEEFGTLLKIIDLFREHNSTMSTIKPEGYSHYSWSLLGTAMYVGFSTEQYQQLIKHGISPIILRADSRCGSQQTQEYINKTYLKPIAKEIFESNSCAGIDLHPEAIAVVDQYIQKLSKGTQSYHSIQLAEAQDAQLAAAHDEDESSSSESEGEGVNDEPLEAGAHDEAESSSSEGEEEHDEAVIPPNNGEGEVEAHDVPPLAEAHNEDVIPHDPAEEHSTPATGAARIFYGCEIL